MQERDASARQHEVRSFLSMCVQWGQRVVHICSKSSMGRLFIMYRLFCTFYTCIRLSVVDWWGVRRDTLWYHRTSPIVDWLLAL